MARSAAYDDILLLDAANESSWTVASGTRSFKVTATHRIDDESSRPRSQTKEPVT